MELPTTLYPIDIAVLAAVLFGAIQGYMRGLSGELARLIGTIVAFVAALLFYQPLARAIAQGTRAEEQVAQVLAFVAAMLGAILVLLLARMILKQLIQVVVNEHFDHLAGMFAGAFRMLLFSAAVLIALLLWPHAPLNNAIREKSIFGHALQRVLPRAERLLGRAAKRLPNSEADGTRSDEKATHHSSNEGATDATRSAVQPAL